MGTMFNRSIQTRFRRQLRTHGTLAEITLWPQLKGRQILGYKFRRQYGVGCYVVDFYCPALRLAIEVDGASHEGEVAKARDRKRQAEIEDHGIHMLRLTDDDVLGDIERAVMAIEAEVMRISHLPCSPSSKGCCS